MERLREKLYISKIFLFLILSPDISAGALFKLTNAVCESYNKTKMEIHECRLRAVRRNVVVLNYNATIYYPANDISVNAQCLKKANGYKPWLMNTTFNLCEYFKRRNNPYANNIFKMIKDFSNFDHKCPQEGHQFIRGFYLKPEMLFIPIPTGDYQFCVTWFYDKVKQAKTNFYFSVVEDLKRT